MILINYYAPNDESSQVRVLLQINIIVTDLDLEQDTSIIWGGQFNLISIQSLTVMAVIPDLRFSHCKTYFYNV